MTVAELLAELRASGSISAEADREAELLLSRALGLDPLDLLLRADQEVAEEAVGQVRAWHRRRRAGEPVAYLFEEREFYGRQFFVDGAVLIPRPETEHVVEEALGRRPEGVWADVGTGSGAIACTLALERPQVHLLALDISPDALAVSARNVRRHGVQDRVKLLASDLLSGVAPRPCLAGITANLPYVESDEFWRLPREVRAFEPRIALVPASATVRELRRRLLDQARDRLAACGSILLEVGAGQAGQARQDMLRSGYRQVCIRNDLAGIGRVVAATWPGR